MRLRCVVCVGIWTGCGTAPSKSTDDPTRVQLSDTVYEPAPLVPRILRDVALVDDDVAFTRPYVPGHRTTMDGRVALRVQGGTEDIERLDTELSFFLLLPETVDTPIVEGPAGPSILSTPTPFDVTFPPALDPDVFRLGHHAICDPTEEFPAAGERPNPYVCGDDDSHDCYDITIISSTSPGFEAQLWGTPATVQVAEPKTASAHIVDVTLGDPVMGVLIDQSTEFTEPAVTVDGRLLTGRLGRLPREWTNPETGVSMTRPYDLVYAQLPEDAEPCDITGWTDFHPMSHAPFDPRMVGTYGLAAWPFRDTEGAPIPDGEDMGGTYPWVDREGANLFMTGVPGKLSEQSETRFPRRCVHAGCEDIKENTDFDRGFMVAGLWTHGKLVHIDGLLNSVYWAVGVSPGAHWLVDLYEDDAGNAVSVRVGGGRFVDAYRNAGGPYPDGYTHNANILDSLQNVANFQETARPVTPRDVVWVMSNGVVTDEVVFDDFLDANAFIVSNMQASITQYYTDAGESQSFPYHHNGQVRQVLGSGLFVVAAELQPEEDEEIHLQNAATSLGWEVPAYGRIEAGETRVEPVALGGVHGRGLWLTGDTSVRYALPEQDAIRTVDAYIGLFVDARAEAGEARELLVFPDGSGLVLDDSRLLLVQGQELLHETELPEASGWRHVGLVIRRQTNEITVLANGLAWDRYTVDRDVLGLDGGELVLGRDHGPWTGLRGWVDDFKVLLHEVDPEVACNHARGTLVAVESNSDWERIAASYPDWAHAEVAEAARESTGTYACALDYSDDHTVHLGTIPDGTRSVREAILFPEGPLRYGVPRPDSTANAFCLTCHTEDSRDGMSIDALAFDPDTPAELDRRRQPGQPPRRVFGNIPAGWIAPGPGPGGPAEAMQAPAEGVVVDAWVLSAE